MIQRAVINTRGPCLRLMDTLAAPRAPAPRPRRSRTLQDVETDHLLETLEAAHWKIEGEHGAAADLGLHPSTLRNRMRKLGIRRPKTRRSG